MHFYEGNGLNNLQNFLKEIATHGKLEWPKGKTDKNLTLPSNIDENLHWHFEPKNHEGERIRLSLVQDPPESAKTRRGLLHIVARLLNPSEPAKKTSNKKSPWEASD
jgi:hypothetical protein